MKRIISIILAIITVLTVSVSFSGCGDDAPEYRFDVSTVQGEER